MRFLIHYIGRRSAGSLRSRYKYHNKSEILAIFHGRFCRRFLMECDADGLLMIELHSESWACNHPVVKVTTPTPRHCALILFLFEETRRNLIIFLTYVLRG